MGEGLGSSRRCFLASRAKSPQLFALLPAASVTCDNLLQIPLSILHPLTEHQIPMTRFASTRHPALSIFILDSITFWFQQRLVLYYIALRCVSLPHRFMSELKDGCPIFCLDSSAGGIVCVLKALAGRALRTYGPYSHVILQASGHFRQILQLACV